MKNIIRRTLVLAGILCATGASASVVTMTGSCDTNCDQLGLPGGGAVSATFELAVAGGANLSIGRADVTAFSIQFGNIAFDNDDLSNWDFRLSTDASGLVNDMQFLASFGTSFANTGDTIDLREDQWWTSHTAACFDGVTGVPCDFSVAGAFAHGPDYEHGSSAFAVAPDVQAVAEPATLALAALALGAAWTFGRRKTVATARPLLAAWA